MNFSHPVPAKSDSQVAPPREPLARAQKASGKAPQTAQGTAAKPLVTSSITRVRRSTLHGNIALSTTVNHLTGREWIFMAPVMALSVVLVTILSQSFPASFAQFLIFSAIAITCAAFKISAFEQGDRPRQPPCHGQTPHGDPRRL